MNIRGHFAEIPNLKRQDALKKVERRKEMEGKTNTFCKTARTCFSKYKKFNLETLETSTQRFGIKELYPRNLFITSYKRPKILKELVCPSELLKKKQGIINKCKSFIKCDECKTCERMNSSGKQEETLHQGLKQHALHLRSFTWQHAEFVENKELDRRRNYQCRFQIIIAI